MFDWGLLIVIFCAVILGWVLGRIKKSRGYDVSALPSAAIKSLTDILNQQNDVSIERFIDEFDVNETTFETHMALGNVSRRRGEIEKAIKIHQNLISRPNLPNRLQDEAYFELAKDYLQAGLLDRAENLFVDLIKTEGPFRKPSQLLLLTLYENEQEWHLALSTAKQLVPKRMLRQRSSEEGAILSRMSHYHCELAQLALDKHDTASAIESIDNAQSIIKNGLRANYLRANLAAKSGDLATVGKLLPFVIFDGSKLSLEALWLAQLCIKQMPKDKAISFIERLYSQVQTVEVLSLLKEYDEVGRKRYSELLEEHIRKEPTSKALQYWVGSSDLPEDKKDLLNRVFERQARSHKHYKCGDCGFSGKQFYWRCPTCKGWDTLQLIRGERFDR